MFFSMADWKSAHPRSRGENQIYDLGYYRERGSSPLTRGKPAVRQYGEGPYRLIPAHAGKTSRADRGFQASGAHPRSRGENLIAPLITATNAGSSPLTRGKRLPRPAKTQESGLIPAHAGKTQKGVDPVD